MLNEQEANWRCTSCSTVNWVRFDPAELKKKMYACCKCGKLYGKFRTNARNKAWLFCLPWHGVGERSPRGVNVDAGTGEMTFGDPVDGKELNRTNYAKKYGWDPLAMFCKQPRNKDHPVCVGFEDRCKKTSESIAEIIAEIDDLLEATSPRGR